MSSSCNDEAILDAARDCVVAFGVRRTTLSEVARRAGVSRPTLYRRWPDVRTLVADLITRELVAVFDRHDPGEGAELSLDSIVDIVTAVVADVRAHPVYRKIVEVDPEVLVPYIFRRLGASQRLAIGRIERLLRAGQRHHSVRDGDVAALAPVVLLVAQAAIQSAPALADGAPTAAIDVEVGTLLRTYLSRRQS